MTVRIMRNVTFFALGVLISLFACMAMAGSYKIGGYYRYGDSVTRKYTSAADAQRLSDVVMKVHLDDAKNARVTTQIAMNLESNLVKARILDDIPVPAAAAASAAAAALKRGRINPSAVVANLLADYAIQKGWELMQEAKCEMKPGGCWNAPASGVNESNASDCDSYSLAWGQKGTYIVHIPGWVCVQTMGSGGPSYNPDKCFWKNNVPVGGGEFAGYYWCRETTPVKYAQSSPATAADVENIAREYYYAQPQQLFNAFMQEGTILSLDDESPVTTTADSVKGQSSVSSSGTTKNPDGSVSEWKTETQTDYAPKGDGKLGGNINIEKTTTSTTTTNTCTVAGSCTSSSSSNTSTEKPKPDPVWTDPDMPKITELYQQKYPGGIKGVWDKKSDAFKQTAFMKSLATLVPSISNGSCPSFSINTNNGWVNGGEQTIPVPCWVYSFIRAVILLTSVFFARSIIFGG